MSGTPRIPGLLLAAAAGALLTSCQDPENSSGSPDTPPPTASPLGSGQGIPNFFAPQPGESWVYRVEREIPHGVALSPEYQALQTEETVNGQLITFQRTRTCVGAFELAGVGKPLTIVDVRENEVLKGRELYDINEEGIFSRGWLSNEEEGSRDVLSEGLAIARRPLQPGASWEHEGASPGHRFEFRVIERVELEVQAGTFDTVRIRFTSESDDGGLLSKRTIWFAEDVGIVMEETVRYGPESVLGREWTELVNWRLPEENQVTATSP